MRSFILGLLAMVVFAGFAAILTSLRALRRRDQRETLLLPPPEDERQVPGHPDAAPSSESNDNSPAGGF